MVTRSPLKVPIPPAHHLAQRACFQGPGVRLVAIATIVGCASPALAQRPFASVSDRPTRGVEVPGASVAGTADATAIETNPGQLGLLAAWSLTLAQSRWNRDSSWRGQGTGLFAAAPLGPLALAGSLQWLAASQSNDGPIENALKSQLGFALGDGDAVGLGVVWNHHFADPGYVLQGVDGVDVGFSLRPFPHLALGTVTHDLNRPRLPTGPSLQQTQDTEIVLRPLGTRRIEVAGGVRHGWKTTRAGWRARLAFDLWPGARVITQYERTSADDLAAQVALGGLGTFQDQRFTLGLALNHADTAGVTVASLASRDGNDDMNWGGSVALRLFGARQDAIFSDRHVEKLALRQIRNEAAFSALLLRMNAMVLDPDVHGVLLDVDGIELGLAQIQELRTLLSKFRAHGKITQAFFTNAGTREYYLASACEVVSMQKTGTLAIDGLAVQAMFFAGALDHVGIHVDLLRIGEYKGAMEPFTQEAFSEKVKENLAHLTDAQARQITEGIRATRSHAVAGQETRTHFTAKQIRNAFDRGLFSADDAKRAGLIDAIADIKSLDTLKGIEVRDAKKTTLAPLAWADPGVSVIFVEGAIVDGPSQSLPFGGDSTAGAETIVEQLDDAAKEGSTRAVVLRVNSPGGSVTASEDIVQAIERVKKAGKKVVVSMGNVAASGGYYIAAPADHIVVEDTTITGSIGIYTFQVQSDRLLDKLGITVDGHGSHKNSLQRTNPGPWSEEVRQGVFDHINHLYKVFLQTVVDGRKARVPAMTIDRVNESGRGKVFTGKEAIGLGLADQSGGLLDAIRWAGQEAKLPARRGGLPMVRLVAPLSQSLVQLALVAAQSPAIPAHGMAQKLWAGLTGLNPREVLGWLVPLLSDQAQGPKAMALAPFLLMR